MTHEPSLSLGTDDTHLSEYSLPCSLHSLWRGMTHSCLLCRLSLSRVSRWDTKQRTSKIKKAICILPLILGRGEEGRELTNDHNTHVTTKDKLSYIIYPCRGNHRIFYGASKGRCQQRKGFISTFNILTIQSTKVQNMYSFFLSCRVYIQKLQGYTHMNDITYRPLSIKYSL
jgi:hypothetical protein